MNKNPKEKNTSKNKTLSNGGKIDVNFPDFCLGINGKVGSKGQESQMIHKIIPFKDSNPYIERTVTIIRSGLGFPTQKTRDILLAMIRIAIRTNGLKECTFPCTIEDIMDELKLVRGGKNSKVVMNNLDILIGTVVKFNSSYIKMQDKDEDNGTNYVESVIAFNLLSGYSFRKYSNGVILPAEDTTEYTKGYITWNAEFFKHALIEGHNLINFDFEIYTSLEGDLARQLFQHLSKQAYWAKDYKRPLEVIAHTILGISRISGTARVKQTMKEVHKTLMKKGVLKVEPVFYKNSKGVEHIHYTLCKKDFCVETKKQETPVKPASRKASLLTGRVGKDYEEYLDEHADPHFAQEIKAKKGISQLDESTIKKPKFTGREIEVLCKMNKNPFTPEFTLADLEEARQIISREALGAVAD